jgi:hypothetical protein
VIADPTVAATVKADWSGVLALRGRVTRAILGSIGAAPSAIFAADAVHNVPLLHAYSVLNDVLVQLEKEGHFRCKTFLLGALLQASEHKLTWLEFDVIAMGVSRRNDLAHRGDVIPRGECWKYIDAVQKQLVSWKLVDAG